MTERFEIFPQNVAKDGTLIIIQKGLELYNISDVVELLNELSEEKDDWKNNCLNTVNENSILWNEISILMEQGAEPSQAFQKYLNGLKNKNERFKDNVK